MGAHACSHACSRSPLMFVPLLLVPRPASRPPPPSPPPPSPKPRPPPPPAVRACRSRCCRTPLLLPLWPLPFGLICGAAKPLCLAGSRHKPHATALLPLASSPGPALPAVQGRRQQLHAPRRLLLRRLLLRWCLRQVRACVPPARHARPAFSAEQSSRCLGLATGPLPPPPHAHPRPHTPAPSATNHLPLPLASLPAPAASPVLGTSPPPPGWAATAAPGWPAAPAAPRAAPWRSRWMRRLAATPPARTPSRAARRPTWASSWGSPAPATCTPPRATA